MPVRTYNLQIDVGRTFNPVFVWITGGQGYNPVGTTSQAIFRQTPVDTPVLTVTTTPNVNGSAIIYLPAITNYPYIPPNSAPDVQPSLIIIYPMQLSLVPADTALLVFPFYQWKWDIIGAGPIIPFAAGSVEALSV